jgi:hypothetical protein
MGDDADTTGAVYGQIAGVFYGLEGIPEKWREKIVFSELILRFADQLCLPCPPCSSGRWYRVKFLTSLPCGMRSLFLRG